MTSLANEILKDQLSADRPGPILHILEEVCQAAGFNLDSEEGREIAVCLRQLYANGYFTVEGLRQAFVAYVTREISGRGLRAEP